MPAYAYRTYLSYALYPEPKPVVYGCAHQALLGVLVSVWFRGCWVRAGE